MDEKSQHFKWHWFLSWEPLMAIFFGINGAALVIADDWHVLQGIYWYTMAGLVALSAVSLLLQRRRGPASTEPPTYFRLLFIAITAFETIGAFALSHIVRAH